MKSLRNLPIYIVGLVLFGALPALHLYAGELPAVDANAVAATDVRVQEITLTELLGALSPENAMVLTSMDEFRELMRLAVDKVSSP